MPQTLCGAAHLWFALQLQRPLPRRGTSLHPRPHHHHRLQEPPDHGERLRQLDCEHRHAAAQRNQRGSKRRLQRLRGLPIRPRRGHLRRRPSPVYARIAFAFLLSAARAAAGVDQRKLRAKPPCRRCRATRQRQQAGGKQLSGVPHPAGALGRDHTIRQKRLLAVLAGIFVAKAILPQRPQRPAADGRDWTKTPGPDDAS